MRRKCFISCKTEDFEYKRIIVEDLNIDLIDKSIHEAVNSEDEDYILRKNKRRLPIRFDRFDSSHWAP